MTVDVDTLVAIGRRAGLCAVGVCRSEPFVDTARILHRRKQDGLHAGMQFTYRNPDRSTDPDRLMPAAAALIVGALDFHTESDDRPYDGRPYGRVAEYARADHYASLRTALTTMAAPLRDEGHRAVVVADENHLVDRAAAHRAAIGWWGKSANILVPGAGSLVVLGAVVTDAPICGADPEPAADGCGSCRRCLDGCPTGAITAPGVVDARRCLAWLVQDTGVFAPDYRVALGDRIYGCDDCADVCPPNQVRVRLGRRAPARTEPDHGSPSGPELESRPESRSKPASGSRPESRSKPASGSRPESRSKPASGSRPESAAPDGSESRAWVSLLDMLSSSDDELMADFGRWYIPRRQPRYLRRNALVVLANVGQPSDPAVRAAVDRALADPDPLVQAHAVWCARRLGLGLDSLQDRDDPLVAAELARAVPRRSTA